MKLCRVGGRERVGGIGEGGRVGGIGEGGREKGSREEQVSLIFASITPLKQRKNLFSQERKNAEFVIRIFIKQFFIM